MPPTPERMEELRTLYIRRQMLNNELSGVLDKISALLLEEPDYRRWAEQDGSSLVSLPSWIHQLTGGRPYLEPQKPVVSTKRQPKKKTDSAAMAMYQQLLKNFTPVED